MCKITDFGMARDVQEDDIYVRTHEVQLVLCTFNLAIASSYYPRNCFQKTQLNSFNAQKTKTKTKNRRSEVILALEMAPYRVFVDTFTIEQDLQKET